MSIVKEEHNIDIKFLKKYNVMDEHIITDIINARKLFYHIYTNEGITQEECQRIIKLELELMELFKKTIQKNDLPHDLELYFGEITNTLISMSNRIEHMYYSTCVMFPIKCVFLVEYMEFKWRNKDFITKESNPIIVLMSKKKCEPQMFIAAGTFAYQKHDIANARQYFVEGIKIHTDNKSLYLAQLWIEVMHLDDVKGDTSNEDIAIQKYRNILEKFKHDMEFHFQLLETSIEMKSIMRLQFEIIFDLMEIYQQSYVMWIKVAKLCLEGFIFDHNIPFFGYSTDFLHRARCCILIYHKGLSKLISVISKRNLMESLNDCLITIWKMNKSINNTEVNILVKMEMQSAFQMGHSGYGGLHTPEYYIYWAIISEDHRPDILKLAIDRNRHNIQVWAEILEYHIIHKSDIETIQMIFEAGNSSLENKALRLWEIMDSFLQQYSDITLLGKFYEVGAHNPYRELNMVYKVHYLAWCHMNSDISSSRRVFDYLITLEPDCKNLYMEMIRFEKQENPINVDIIKKLYRSTCSKFCQQENDVSLWTECIEFELTYFGRFSAEKIFKAALRNVKPQLKLDLRRNYQSLIDGHSIRAVNMQPVIIVDLTNEE